MFEYNDFLVQCVLNGSSESNISKKRYNNQTPIFLSRLNPVTSQGGSWPVQNVILQPVSPVCLQPVANTGVEGSSEPTNLQPLGNKEAPAAVFVSPDGMQTVQVGGGLFLPICGF